MIRIARCLLVIIMPFTIGAGDDKWVPLPLDALRNILEDGKKTEKEKVEFVLLEMKKRLTMEYPRGENRKAREISSLMYMLAFGGYRLSDEKSRKGRALAIRVESERLSREGGPQGLQLRADVCLELAQNSVEPQKSILKFLRDPSTSEDEILIALGTLNETSRIELLPRFLEWIKNERHLVVQEGVGKPNPRLVFPLRDQAVNILEGLGIKLNKNVIDRKEINIEGKNVQTQKMWPDVIFKEIVADVDRSSLLRKLKEWIVSDNMKNTNAALRAACDIEGKDVGGMLDEFSRGVGVNASKAEYIRKTLKRLKSREIGNDEKVDEKQQVIDGQTTDGEKRGWGIPALLLAGIVSVSVLLSLYISSKKREGRHVPSVSRREVP